MNLILSYVKWKYLLAVPVIVMFSALVELSVYLRLNNRVKGVLYPDKFATSAEIPQVIKTSMQMQEGPIDFTYAAEQTVHAVVHVRVSSTVTAGDEYDIPLFEFFNGNNARQP